MHVQYYIHIARELYMHVLWPCSTCMYISEAPLVRYGAEGPPDLRSERRLHKLSMQRPSGRGPICIRTSTTKDKVIHTVGDNRMRCNKIGPLWKRLDVIDIHIQL